MSEERNVPVSEPPEGIPPAPEGIGGRALSGVAWSYIAVSIVALGQIVFTVIMSRLVSPEAFGLIAMSGLARGIGTLLSGMGVGAALIQKPSLSEEDKRAGFTLSVLSGIFFFGLFWALAPALGRLFTEVRAVSVIRGASLAFVALGLNTTEESLMRREMRFRELSQIHIVGFLIGYFVIGIGSALAGAGVWALVLPPIAHTLISALLTYLRIRNPLRPTRDLSSYRALLSFGSRLSVIQLGEFFGSQIDTIVVARNAGTALLGMYNRAFYLAVLPLQMIMYAMNQILFASFSRIQSELQRLKVAYMTSTEVANALFLPASAALAAAGGELIVVLLGERYREVAVLVPFFAAYAALNRMSLLCGLLCEAVGELNKRLALQAVYVAGLVSAMIAVAGGPLWVYAAVLAGGEAGRLLAFNVLIIRKIIPVSLSELVKMYVPGLIAAALVLVAVIATRVLVHDLMGLSPIIALVAEGAAAAATFIVLVRRGPLSFMRNEILSRIPVDLAGSGRNRLLTFVIRFLLGSLPEVRA